MLAVAQQALHLAPTAAKYFVILLLVLNAGSFPLVWHFRVWSRVFELRSALLWHHVTHFYLGKDQKKLALQVWYESYLPIGVHPFRAMWKYQRFVGECLDDSDFNLHMSNSSYAKALDSARFRLALATFPNIFRCGGWVPLAATHFHYIREIPMLTRYEVRTTIGAWDEKWIWCVSRFVKPPSKSQSRKQKSHPSQNENEAHIASALALATGVASAIPSLKTPATPLGGMSGVDTPVSGVAVGDNLNNNGGTHGMNGNGSANEPDAVSRALLKRAVGAVEADGALLYTVAVSQLCYKQGRITVPPAVVLASNGFYAAPSSSSSAEGKGTTEAKHGNTAAAPPYWPAVRALNASMPKLAQFFAGGWRGVEGTEGQEGDGQGQGGRFWEEAFEACEAERRERLVPFIGEAEGRRSGLSGGLEGVRGLGAGAGMGVEGARGL
ncbi:hypothetical protein DFH06DRAFT_987340 [Mycena polygramma]|nr:hypothetical protein DFH06DRAFT_987340 [Mycena polygramma]